MDKMRLNIDGRELTGYRGQMILEVANENGIDIPSFCNDERLDAYGSCGICFVEVEGMPKLMRACATEISDGMVIRTDTPRVRESRKVNLELLLSQHSGDCRAPCTRACPAQTDCQGYVGLIANGEFEESLKLIKNKIPFAASIGRVCPHPCEDACRRAMVDEPVSIMNLKRFAADIDLSNPEPYLPEIASATGKKVGIVGGGPGGLSCAYYLAQMGHNVTVYEAMPKMGGMLRYGIPEYRLPKVLVDKEAALISRMGVVFNNNVRIGVDKTFESLRDQYDAVVIAVGAWESLPLPVTGGDLPGVFGGTEFLRRIFDNEPLWIGNSVAVVGGGNTAMDACRTAIRLGAENVYIIYRRTKAEMPANEEEITESEEEGVIFRYLVTPIEIIERDGRAAVMRLQKMKLGEPDESGRRRPVPIEGEEETLEVDTVVAALGQGVDPQGFPGIRLTRGNTIVSGEHVFTTNEKGVFAIGDCINEGAAIAIKAIGDAKKAAVAVDRYLTGADIEHKEPYRVVRDDLTAEDFADIKKEPRLHARILEADDRIDSFFELTETFDTDSAKIEADRCLECGCHDYFECKLIALSDKHGVQPDRFRESVLRVELKDDHPFINRDPNKCILCGKCVRVCEEIIGSGAISFTDRGFDTIVRPAFEDALRDTSCVSCGQCVAVCPTGALQEKNTFKKPVPLDTKKTDTICGICSVGCTARVESSGNMLIKTTPIFNNGINDGVMCGRGRFGINYVQKDGRLTTPLLRRKGVLIPVSWHDAFVYAAKKMESIGMRGEKTAVSIGQTYCIEDAGAVKNLAKFLGAEMFSFANRKNGLEEVLGFGSSPNTLEEVLGTNGIFVFGSALLKKPVVLAKLRQATAKGIPVTVISNEKDDYNLPCKLVCVDDSTVFIKQVVKALIEAGCSPKNADGFTELKDSLSSVEVTADAKALADDYRAAKKVMILYSLGELTTTAATELANMAVVSGHIGSPRDGIYMMRQMAGSQVLADYGISKTAEDLTGVKGLMVFGEDPESLPDELKFLMVQDMFLTKTAEKADIVFPLVVYPEIDGTFVNTERKVLHSLKAVEPPALYRTSEIAQKIAEILEGSAPAGFLRELYPKAKAGQSDESTILYTDGFGFPDMRAKLRVVGEAPMFDELATTCCLQKAVDIDIPRRL